MLEWKHPSVVRFCVKNEKLSAGAVQLIRQLSVQFTSRSSEFGESDTKQQGLSKLRPLHSKKGCTYHIMV
ncbi:uncharacterized [Tachysurus ichikawai]